MMKRKLIAAILISTGLLLASCQKDVDQFIPDPGQAIGPDTAWYSNITTDMPVTLLRNALLSDFTKDTIEVNSMADSIPLRGYGYCKFFPFSCVTPAGVPVTGPVTVEWNLVKSKGDMIRMNRASSSHNRLLVNGAGLSIALKKDGQPLQLAPGIHLSIDFYEANNTTVMSFFAGSSLTQNFTWLTNPDPLNNMVSPTNMGYHMFTNRLGWNDYGYFYDTTGITRTKISASLPANYTNANSIMYAAFDNQLSVMELNADVVTEKFISPLLPDGKAVNIITISKQGEDYYISKIPLIIDGHGTGIQEISILPVKRTLAEIITFLSSF